jgi:hypothetical protein
MHVRTNEKESKRHKIIIHPGIIHLFRSNIQENDDYDDADEKKNVIHKFFTKHNQSLEYSNIINQIKKRIF